MPFPSEETTPPVMKMNRVLAGGSAWRSGAGRFMYLSGESSRRGHGNLSAREPVAQAQPLRARPALRAFGHPVTAIVVLRRIVAVSCATNSVGIASLLLQRLPFAASAENLPSGRVSSKVPTGTSGTVLNVLLVIPALLMNVVPTRSTVTP